MRFGMVNVGSSEVQLVSVSNFNHMTPVAVSLSSTESKRPVVPDLLIPYSGGS
jgi:hypothetical protein